MSSEDAADLVEFSAEDADDFDSLHGELQGVPGIAVRAVSTPPAPGEQGAMLDFLTVACSGGAITVLLEIIKDLLASRGPHFVLRLRRGRTRLEVTADTVDEMLPLIKQLFDRS